MTAARAILLAVPLLAGTGEAPDGYATAPDEPVTFTEREIARILQHSPLAPPPPDPTNRFADDPAAARLGQFLFFDPRLSINGEVSCAICHDPERSFTDARPIAIGVTEALRNTPPLWNLAHQRWYFWDGRADSLWAQAQGPIENDLEMRGSRLRAAHLVHGDAGLRVAYEALFGPLPDLSDPRFPTEAKPIPASPEDPRHVAWMAMSEADRTAVNHVWANVGKAIAAYERRLISNRAPFDIFVEGLRENDPAKLAALPPAARRGLRLFIGRGNCRLCHSGPNFTDGEFHNLGIPDRRGGIGRDSGRFQGLEELASDPFNAAGRFSDAPTGEAAQRTRSTARLPETWGQFKTPSLRNVARTAPYMHQGRFSSLDSVLRFYSKLDETVQVGHHRESILVPLNLTGDEIADLAAFLESLTDVDLPPELAVQPQSPTMESESAAPR
jgi:cytochrome c peroxidase